MEDKKELNLEDTENISGGMPPGVRGGGINYNPQTDKEWDKEYREPCLQPIDKNSNSEGNTLSWE